MCIMQDASTDILCIYDAKIGLGMYSFVFCPYPEVKPHKLYFTMKAFGELYRLKNWVRPEYAENEFVFAQAATDGSKKAFMITNISEEENNAIKLQEDDSLPRTSRLRFPNKKEIFCLRYAIL